MTRRRNSVDIGAMSPYMRRALDAKLKRDAPRETAQAEMPGMETSEAVALVVNQQRAVAARKAKKDFEESAVDRFDRELRAYELPVFEREVMFAKEAIDRRWKFDFGNRQYMLAIEIEGLVVMKLAGELVVRGRHASISGFKEDAIKYANAAILGWTVLRFEQSQVKDGTAIDLTQRVLYAKGWRPAE